MKILKLELYGYARLTTFNIKHFVYTPTAKYQLILGTNGSGKSSILSELSPLPGHHSQYSKDGYKKIDISHAGRDYRLSSIFKTNKHSFVVDGEELNPGGTAEVQKTLAFQHFGITKDIHELMTGEVLLTQLSATERRKWITMISQVDYGFAMGAFKKLASRARDQQGALKDQRLRLTQQTHALQSMQDIDGLEERSLKLREELNHLMLERVPNLPKLDSLKAQLQSLYSGLRQQATDYFKSLVYQPSGKQYRSNDDVLFDLQRLDTNIQAGQSIIQRMGDEYGDMESMVNAVRQASGEQFDDLPTLIQNQLEELARLAQAPQIFKELNSPTEMQRDWKTISSEVMVTFKQLPDNADRRYTHETVRVAQQDMAAQQRVIDTASAKINQMRARIDLMNEAKETQCPSCKYIWRPGYSEAELTELECLIVQQGELIQQANARTKKLEAFVEECAGYEELYQQFRGYIRGYPRLQPLWDYILKQQLLLNNPKNNLGLFLQWERELELNAQHEQGRTRLQQYREVQERQSSIGDTAVFTRRLHTLQVEIEQATNALSRDREERNSVDKYLKKFKRLQDIALKMENDYNEIERRRSLLMDALKNEIIDETVMAHQVELGGIMRRLSEKESLEGIIRDSEQNRIRLELETRTLQLLVRALSPNEGLIAEQLSSDIGCLVAQLNSVISSIWTYDMTVLSCGIESGELDYKFPVFFADNSNVPPDVAKTSKGQRQVINIAFQLTVMLYLNLIDYPLFLDEPGEGFDEQHRVQLMDFIKQLMDTNRHNQLFMVSHYASGHGAFTNAEVLVLNASNIAVPGAYNQHVVLG